VKLEQRGNRNSDRLWPKQAWYSPTEEKIMGTVDWSFLIVVLLLLFGGEAATMAATRVVLHSPVLSQETCDRTGIERLVKQLTVEEQDGQGQINHGHSRLPRRLSLSSSGARAATRPSR